MLLAIDKHDFGICKRSDRNRAFAYRDAVAGIGPLAIDFNRTRCRHHIGVARGPDFIGQALTCLDCRTKNPCVGTDWKRVGVIREAAG